MFLYGASGHCKVIIDIIKSSGIDTVETIYDDKPKLEMILGIPVRKMITEPISKSSNFIISIGNNKIRKEISKKLEVIFAKALHQTSIISESVAIGNGSVVMAGAIINADTVVGEHCIINSGAVIEHDCKIEDFAHISPNATLAGNVTVGEGTWVGAGSVIIQGITIGKWCTIGAGSVLIKDIPDGCTVVGNPARIIKKSE